MLEGDRDEKTLKECQRQSLLSQPCHPTPWGQRQPCCHSSVCRIHYIRKRLCFSNLITVPSFAVLCCNEIKEIEMTLGQNGPSHLGAWPGCRLHQLPLQPKSLWLGLLWGCRWKGSPQLEARKPMSLDTPPAGGTDKQTNNGNRIPRPPIASLRPMHSYQFSCSKHIQGYFSE